MVFRLLLDLAVDTAHPPDIGVLSLFDHDTVTQNHVLLFGINHDGTASTALTIG
jgi:hypothetical protein